MFIHRQRDRLGGQQGTTETAQARGSTTVPLATPITQTGTRTGSSVTHDATDKLAA